VKPVWDSVNCKTDSEDEWYRSRRERSSYHLSHLVWPHLNWAHFTWIECSVWSVAAIANWTAHDPVLCGLDQSQHSQFRWNEVSWDKWYERSFMGLMPRQSPSQEFLAIRNNFNDLTQPQKSPLTFAHHRLLTKRALQPLHWLVALPINLRSHETQQNQRRQNARTDLTVTTEQKVKTSSLQKS